MKWELSIQIAFLCLTVGVFGVVPNVSAYEQILVEQIVSGSIDDPIQVKKYFFSANANDHLFVRISRTEGRFNPEYRLYSPNGKLIYHDYTGGSLIKDSWTIPANGTYDLLIFDYRGDNIGKFSFVITRINHTLTPTLTPTQIVIQNLTIQDIQKSSETAPEVNIEPIEGKKFHNTTVLLSGSASSDSGIENVTVNGKYAGTENWNVPLNLSFGDNNIVILAIGKDGNTTATNISLSVSASEPKNNIIDTVFSAVVSAIISVIVTPIIGVLLKKWIERGNKKKRFMLLYALILLVFFIMLTFW